MHRSVALLNPNTAIVDWMPLVVNFYHSGHLLFTINHGLYKREQMKAVISSTYDDLYFFFLPIVAWSWNKLGIEPICILPKFKAGQYPQKLLLAEWTMGMHGVNWTKLFYEAPEHKNATYAQCSRLYAAAADDIPDDEILITGDIDMAVFNKDYFQQANNGQINVFGADLVPEGQYPICYISMPAKTWREVMWLKKGEGVQKPLDRLLGDLECEHFRGNYWGKDQETIYQHLTAQAWPVEKHYRAKQPNQFATRRADRDGWPDTAAPDIIDAHLPRAGYPDENFLKIIKLFRDLYPDEDLGWMTEYRDKYIKLLEDDHK